MQNDKIRPIDDFSEFLVNSAFGLHEKAALKITNDGETTPSYHTQIHSSMPIEDEERQAAYRCSGRDESNKRGVRLWEAPPISEDDNAKLENFHKNSRSRRRAGVLFQSASYENGGASRKYV